MRNSSSRERPLNSQTAGRKRRIFALFARIGLDEVGTEGRTCECPIIGTEKVKGTCTQGVISSSDIILRVALIGFVEFINDSI